MQVVADAGAIGGGVVVPEDPQALQSPGGDLGDERKQVVGDAEGVFADLPGWMGAHGVEVAQVGDSPGACGRQGIEELFHGQLALCIGMDRRWSHGFHKRKPCGFSIDGACAAEHQRSAVVRIHGCDQRPRTAQVDIPVAQRFGYGFTHGFQASEVDHGFDRLARCMGFGKQLIN